MTKQLRTLVHLRDENCCQKCGLHFPKRGLQCHHILPQRLGGPNELFNLICLCNKCHVDWHKVESKYDMMWKASEAIHGFWEWLNCEDWEEICREYREDLYYWSEDFLKHLLTSLRKQKARGGVRKQKRVRRH